MFRSIVGVILGYIVLSLVFFAVFTCAYFVLGVERIFQPDSYRVSTLWLVLSAAISLGGSMLGGSVCAAISKNKRTCWVFAGIVLIVLVMFCIPKMRDTTPHPRSGEISQMDAMRLTQMPIWMHLLNPVLGAVGVLFGARMKGFPAA
jgi:heme/copper-type cytochrome/quinol oxidase subunit 3